MRRRSEAEQVEHRGFAEGVPAVHDHPALGPPAVRQQRRMAVAHPVEIEAVVDHRGQAWDLGIAGEALADTEDAAHQQRRVDRRHFALPLARPGVDVDPVIEPAVLVLLPLGKRAQRRARALEDGLARLPAPFRRDAHPRQAEADRRDAADLDVVVARRRSVGARSVADDARRRIGLLPEERERAPRQILEERVVIGGGRTRLRRTRASGGVLPQRGRRRGSAECDRDRRPAREPFRVPADRPPLPLIAEAYRGQRGRDLRDWPWNSFQSHTAVRCRRSGTLTTPEWWADDSGVRDGRLRSLPARDSRGIGEKTPEWSADDSGVIGGGLRSRWRRTPESSAQDSGVVAVPAITRARP